MTNDKSPVITLKHLARDFELDPYALRMALREEGLQPQINRRWKWLNRESSEYLRARTVAKDLSSRLRRS